MEYLGHVFVKTNIFAQSGTYYKCSRCSVLLFDGVFFKLHFVNKNLLADNVNQNLTCNEVQIKKLLE